MSKIRLLIVDDSLSFRKTIHKILDMQPDMEVVGEGEDGVDALEKAAELMPQIVIMDVGMPKMSGIEATQHLRQKLPETKVIGLSMHDNDEYRKSMLEAGAEAYILKEASLPDLLSTIRRTTS